MDEEVKAVLCRLQGEQLAQLMAIRLILRAMPDVRRALADYRTVSSDGRSGFDPITTESLEHTLDMLTREPGGVAGA